MSPKVRSRTKQSLRITPNGSWSSITQTADFLSSGGKKKSCFRYVRAPSQEEIRAAQGAHSCWVGPGCLRLPVCSGEGRTVGKGEGLQEKCGSRQEDSQKLRQTLVALSSHSHLQRNDWNTFPKGRVPDLLLRSPGVILSFGGAFFLFIYFYLKSAIWPRECFHSLVHPPNACSS